jgi:acyl-CoA thioesterase FadM
MFLLKSKPAPVTPRPTAAFEYRHIVCIGDTNITRSVYFTKYQEWMGYARERMVLENLSVEDVIGGDTILVTKSTAVAYLREFSLYDEALVLITIGRVTPTTSVLCYRIVEEKSGELYAVAKQLILFAGSNGKAKMIPLKYLVLPRKYPEHEEAGLDNLIAKRLLRNA